MGTESERKDVCLWMWSLAVGPHVRGMQRGSQPVIKLRSRDDALSKKVRIRERAKVQR